MQEFGGLCQWLINVLNLVTGNLDAPGGAMFTLPAFDPISAPEAIAPRGSFGRWHSRVRQLPEFAGELPVAALAEEVLTAGPGQIKALVTHGGNPVLSTPNGRELDRAFAGLEFMAAIDIYINETTRHANIILPPTAPLERGHYDLAFHLLGVRNVAKFSPPLFATNGDTRHEWEIFLALQTRMETAGALGRLKHHTTKRWLDPERLLDLGLRFGPYGDKLNPLSKGLNLRRLKAAVHGIDFGPLQTCLIGRLRTADKRIHLAPEIFIKDIERLKVRTRPAGKPADPTSEAAVENVEHGSLLLIGRRQLRSNNSWLHNSQRMVNGKPRCTMIVHPDDANARALESGQRVLVTSRTGSIEIPIEISAEVMPGVVSIPHGWGHNRSGSRIAIAEQHAGESINDLTDNQAIDALCGTAAFSGIPVTVRAMSIPASDEK
jgi:anaerobic selenocysteine-containing dehydrogenase